MIEKKILSLKYHNYRFGIIPVAAFGLRIIQFAVLSRPQRTAIAGVVTHTIVTNSVVQARIARALVE